MINIMKIKDNIMNRREEYYNKQGFTEEPWEVINSYFRHEYLQRLVRNQLESFNDFTKNQLPKTIEMFNPVVIRSENDFSSTFNKYALEIKIEFDNFSIFRPQIHENNGATKIMIPQEARLRNFTYASTMTVDLNITYLIRSGEELKNEQRIIKKMPRIHIGKLPIMLKSDICVLKQYQHINNNITGECRFPI